MYILNRDAAARLTISSPLEAHKANTLVYHVVGVDVGFENPMFACLEMDYEVRRTRLPFAILNASFLFCPFPLPAREGRERCLPLLSQGISVSNSPASGRASGQNWDSVLSRCFCSGSRCSAANGHVCFL